MPTITNDAYDIWTESFPPTEIFRSGNHRWVTRKNENYTLPFDSADNEWLFLEFPFIAFGADIIGISFTGTNTKVRMSITDTSDLVIAEDSISADSGNDSIVYVDTSCVKGTEYYVKLYLTKTRTGENAVINDFRVMNLDVDDVWTEHLPAQLI